MKPKIKPVPLLSREALDSAVASHATLKIQYAAAKADMELEIARVQERHQATMLDIAQGIEASEASIYVYCVKHRAELFPDKKSIDFLLATVGFRTEPPSVEKAAKRDTWEAIAARLAALDWGGRYITDPAPVVNKKQLLTDRDALTAPQLEEAGLRFEQDEVFYITPKSEVAQTSSVNGEYIA